MAFKTNIGAFLPDKSNSTFETNIGAYFNTAGIAITGTGSGISTGDIGVLLRPVPILGTGGGLSSGNSPYLANPVNFYSICYSESGASGFLTLDKNLIMTGGALASGNISGSLWVSQSFILNDSDYRIQLIYDPDNLGLLITRTNMDSLTNDNYWFDLRTKGFYPEIYTNDATPYSGIYYPHQYKSYTGLLIGGQDGYIRTFDRKVSNDKAYLTTEAISSYFLSPAISLGNEDTEGKLSYLIFTLSGKGLGSSADKSDSISYDIYVGDTPEDCYMQIEDGDTPVYSNTITGAGRSLRSRCMGRGAYAVIKIYNNNTSETWGINNISGTIKSAGRVR